MKNFRNYLSLLLLFLIVSCGGGQEYEYIDTEEKAAEINNKIGDTRSVLVNDRVFFKFDSALLDSMSKKTLDKIVEWLANNKDAKILIEGHCDERGTREYNLALGQRRASAAQKYLISRGVSSSRIRTISYGKERPALLGKGEAIWSKNRRAVVVVNSNLTNTK